MLEDINKWGWIIALTVGIFTTTVFDAFLFIWEHLDFTQDLIVWTLLSVIGQFFVYRMIKHFKQHIVPFVISTRKIFTVLLSIIFYQHATYWVQILGIFIVFITVTI